MLVGSSSCETAPSLRIYTVIMDDPAIPALWGGGELGDTVVIDTVNVA
jgi:hypothetical protein